MRENVVREFIEMSAAYAKDTAHVRKQFETPAEQTQHLTTLAPKVTTEAAQPLSGVVGAPEQLAREWSLAPIPSYTGGIRREFRAIFFKTTCESSSPPTPAS
jgi:hypothetical protein